MMTFDAAGRETCAVRDSRTNTPLQALDAAERVDVRRGGPRARPARDARRRRRPTSGIAWAFRLVTARPPSAARAATCLRTGLDAPPAPSIARTRPRRRSCSRIGESTADPKLDAAELAAYTAVCSVILNLDETVTKE